MINLPIFRAKKLDSDEYVEGGYSDTSFLCMGDVQGHYISYKKINVVGREITLQESIDPTTISIHFPDMIDSQKNKIFASLQEDGKGGDVILFCEVENITGTAIYEKSSIFITGGCSEYLSEILQREDEDFKIIGIQQ